MNNFYQKGGNMQTKKIIMVFAMVFCAVFLFSMTASAAPGWYVCTIDMVGPGFGSIYIQLTDTLGSFGGVWQTIPAGQQKELLAVLLTAMVNDMEVSVYFDPALTFSEINAVYLRP
jgi:hypothetical protein